MFQDRNDVLIREQGNRTYNAPVSLSESAKELWEYDVYTDGWKDPSLTPREQALSTTRLPDPSEKSYSKACEPTGLERFRCLVGACGRISPRNLCGNTPVK